MTITELKELTKTGSNLVLYCAGKHGAEFKKLLKLCGIEVKYFCDNSKDKIGRYIDGVLCMNPVDIATFEECYVVICTGIEFYKDLFELACSQGIKKILDFREILDGIIYDTSCMERIIYDRFNYEPTDLFYTNFLPIKHSISDKTTLKGNRVAVYTSCFGDYDCLLQPVSDFEWVDYFYVSDEKPEELGKYKWVNAKEYVPEYITDFIKRNRYVKMHPHILFAEYKYSIYIDANVQIIGDISHFLCETKTGMCVFSHSRRDCLYYEAMTIVNYRRVVPEDVAPQIKRYLFEGMPLHFGLAELPVIAREHNNPLCRKIMEDWWTEFDQESQRDQISFPYVLWKNGISFSDLAIIGDNVRHNDALSFFPHLLDSENVKNDGKE